MDPDMAFKASHMYAKVTPRKARLVADLVRGMNVNRALDTLQFNPRRPAALLRAVIRSALANAGQAQGVNLNQLVLKECFVNEGPRVKRGKPVARGRHHRILKCTSHIHVVLDAAAAPVEVPPAAGGRV
jgi:large subunit ribosomal protein L22